MTQASFLSDVVPLQKRVIAMMKAARNLLDTVDDVRRKLAAAGDEHTPGWLGNSADILARRLEALTKPGTNRETLQAACDILNGYRHGGDSVWQVTDAGNWISENLPQNERTDNVSTVEPGSNCNARTRKPRPRKKRN